MALLLPLAQEAAIAGKNYHPNSTIGFTPRLRVWNNLKDGVALFAKQHVPVAPRLEPQPKSDGPGLADQVPAQRL